MSMKPVILMIAGILISGLAFYMRKRLRGLCEEALQVAHTPASSVDFLQVKNFGEFPVEIPEGEFEGWGM
jgi:hypothetical protein